MYYVLDREVVVEKDLFVGELMDGFWSPPLPHLKTAEHSTHTIVIIFP